MPLTPISLFFYAVDGRRIGHCREIPRGAPVPQPGDTVSLVEFDEEETVTLVVKFRELSYYRIGDEPICDVSLYCEATTAPVTR